MYLNMITRQQALEILHENMQSQNLRRHCYAVGAVMKVLAEKLDGNPQDWEVAGLLHDADYEKTNNLLGEVMRMLNTMISKLKA